MRFSNFLFYLVFFISFCLPTNTNFYIPLPGVLLKFSEFGFILLPIINIFCNSKNSFKIRDIRLFKYILIFFLIVFTNEFIIKYLFYLQSPTNAIKSIRIGLPLFSTLLLIKQGIRVNIYYFWKVVLVTVSFSVFISFLSFIFPLPIYSEIEEGVDLISQLKGRIINSNAIFGLIGAYFLFSNDNNWYAKGKLLKVTAILSCISLIISFNRTSIALLLLEILFLTWKNLNIKVVLRFIFLTSLFLYSLMYLYNNNAIIQRQLDKRVFSIIEGSQTISESTIEGNREVIYEGVIKRIQQGYWLIGMPYHIPIFTWPAEGFRKEPQDMTKTDTTFINILLRYGIFSFVLVILIFRRMSKLNRNKLYKSFYILLLIGSLNIDLLFSQNSIFFLFIVFFVGNSMDNLKRKILVKN